MKKVAWRKRGGSDRPNHAAQRHSGHEAAALAKSRQDAFLVDHGNIGSILISLNRDRYR